MSSSGSYDQYIAVSFCCFFLLTLFICFSVGPLWAAVSLGIWLFSRGSPPTVLTLLFCCSLGFLSHFFFFFTSSSAFMAFSTFLKYVFPEVPTHGWGSQLCPVVGLLEPTVSGMVSSHRGHLCSLQLLTPCHYILYSPKSKTCGLCNHNFPHFCQVTRETLQET